MLNQTKQSHSNKNASEKKKEKIVHYQITSREVSPEMTCKINRSEPVFLMSIVLNPGSGLNCPQKHLSPLTYPSYLMSRL